MAIEFYGFSAAGKKLNTAWWARFDALASLGKHVVGSGGVVTSGGATRLLSVSAYEAKVPGVIVADSAVSSVAAGANGGGSNRLDYVALVADWGPETVALQMLPGGAALPTLTQTPGVLWQMPLAAVTVRPGVTTIAAADIRIVKPLPREARLAQSIPVLTTVNRGGAKVIDSLTLSDPGWPYKVRVTAQVRFNPSSGFGILNAIVNGVTIGASYSPSLAAAGGHMTHLDWSTNSAQSGNLTVQLEATNSQMGTGDQLEMNNAPVHVFTVEQKPA